MISKASRATEATQPGANAQPLLVVLMPAAPRGRMQTGGGEPADWTYWLKLALGILFLLLAAKQWQGRPRGGQEAEGPKWMQTIDEFSPGKAGGLAAALVLANPKNLVLVVGGAVSIASSGASAGDKTLGVVLMVVVASLCVLLPLGVFFFGGDKAEGTLAGWKAWMAAHNSASMIVLLVVFSVRFDGAGQAAETAAQNIGGGVPVVHRAQYRRTISERKNHRPGPRHDSGPGATCLTEGNGSEPADPHPCSRGARSGARRGGGGPGGSAPRPERSRGGSASRRTDCLTPGIVIGDVRGKGLGAIQTVIDLIGCFRSQAHEPLISANWRPAWTVTCSAPPWPARRTNCSPPPCCPSTGTATTTSWPSTAATSSRRPQPGRRVGEFVAHAAAPRRLHDWEAGQSRRRFRRTYPADRLKDGLHDRWWTKMITPAWPTHFFVGNVAARPRTFILLGLFQPTVPQTLEAAQQDAFF